MPLPPNRLTASQAAQILGIAYPATFYRLLAAQHLVYDQLTGLQPYPAEYRQDLPGSQHRAKEVFDREHSLVVVEWGGMKPARGQWVFDRHRCEAVRDRGLDAVREARQAWGLGLSSRRSGSRSSRDHMNHQESAQKRRPKTRPLGERPDPGEDR